MSWTEVFPIFDDEMVEEFEREATLGERTELEEWYGVAEIFGAREARHVVSYSLFWKNVRVSDGPLPKPSRKMMQNAVELGLARRFDPWKHYVEPLLNEIPKFREKYPDVAFRVYLAKDLEFLIGDLLAAGCEVYWMKHSSLGFAPGGLWRFLPIEEEGRLVTVADIDRMEHLDGEIARTEAMARAGLGMWRVPVYTDTTKNGAVSYLPVVGCQSGWRGGVAEIRRLVDAFTWKCRRGEMPTVVDYPNCGPRMILQARWPDYGFDEWFITAAVYPRAAQAGVLTFVPTTAKGQLLTLDIEYVTWANPNSQLVYFPVENCCGGKTGPVDGAALHEEEVPAAKDEEADEVEEAVPGIEAPQPKAKKEVKVGLLFLTRGDLHHPKVWEEYVAAEPGRLQVLFHAKRPEEVVTGPLAGYLIEERHETEWGDVSLVRAMAALLRAGLENEGLTHFMFLSESCLPIRPATELLEVLALDGRSRFAFTDVAGIEKNQPGKLKRVAQGPEIPRDRWRFHSQWTLLDREAAQKILAVDFIDPFAGVFAADESWVGTSLAMGGWDLSRKIVRSNPTWTRWRQGLAHPELVEKVTPRLLAEWKTSGCFFARKVAPDAMKVLQENRDLVESS